MKDTRLAAGDHRIAPASAWTQDPGKVDPERCATAGGVVDGDVAFHGLSQSPHDVQTQTSASLGASRRRFELGELVEDLQSLRREGSRGRGRQRR